MLRHLYAAITPHKNAATPFLEGRAEEVFNYAKHAGIAQQFSFWPFSVCHGRRGRRPSRKPPFILALLGLCGEYSLIMAPGSTAWIIRLRRDD